ncbi:MAG: hypothetical protein AB7G11_06200 [Phycisphaerales bacterium]
MSAADVVKLLVIFAAVSVSVISWIAKTLQEQKKIKDAREAARRRQEQLLRTGRDDASTIATSTAPTGADAPPPTPLTTTPTFSAPSSHADARRRLQELAERRKQQLDELRRRQAGSPPATPMQPPSPVAVEQRPPTRPATPTARPVPARPAAPQPSARPKQPKTSKRQGREPQQAEARARREQSERAAAHTVRDAQATPDSYEPQPRPRPAAAIALAGARAGSLSPGDWRRAILLREILDRPMSERDDPFRDRLAS